MSRRFTRVDAAQRAIQRAETSCLEDDIARLQKEVDHHQVMVAHYFPHTADEKPIWPGMTLYSENEHGMESIVVDWVSASRSKNMLAVFTSDGEDLAYELWHSTEESAAAARKALREES